VEPPTAEPAVGRQPIKGLASEVFLASPTGPSSRGSPAASRKQVGWGVGRQAPSREAGARSSETEPGNLDRRVGKDGASRDRADGVRLKEGSHRGLLEFQCVERPRPGDDGRDQGVKSSRGA